MKLKTSVVVACFLPGRAKDLSPPLYKCKCENPFVLTTYYIQCYMFIVVCPCKFNLLKPTGYVMHQQFNIQQLYALPTLYLCVLYLSDNKQRLVPLTA